MIILELKPFFRNGKEWIGLHEATGQSLFELLKHLSRIKWNHTAKHWYIPCTRNAYEDLKEQLKKQLSEEFELDTSALRQYLEQRKTILQPAEFPVKYASAKMMQRYPLSNENLKALEAYRNKLVVKGYSKHTIRNYLNEFHQLLRILADRPVNDLGREHIQSYLLWLLQEQGCSETKVHTSVNAIKFYFEQVMERAKEFYDLPRPKKPFKLPAVLAEEEVLQMIQGIRNLKHKTILMAGYAGGLRVSEIIGLKITDIDSKRMMIHIHGAKGKKDRMVPLSKVLLATLRDYYLAYKPKEYIFESITGGMYSARSIQKILQHAKETAGIKKKGSVHMLRHSYATHLMENGTDITIIQKLLGHNSIRTTMLYTHVSQHKIAAITSPLDKLKW